ncbi:MAG: hypothetical protein LBQ72_00315 [Flavobacteriales bacterium]|uniref:BamA/OMP85 family outer membrane protein n=1 Tax=Blattabacterium sp. (Mastotermes darwiniensis) TaxID=39768 RepID=UPI000231DEF5|nr:POTRA domain-containing protein [Blattabacterium sp. (Mastotermes darwiniensis)]AER40809.1 outer membrane protein [Blattabacterium sp. (Mastotermes darwiniensis) str. MADAR]MDR1804656.1 hypothetical protein [Flavobacteriales bacterium]
MERLYKSKNLFLFSFFILLQILSAQTEKFKDPTKETSTFIVRNILITGKTKHDPHFISNLSHIFSGDTSIKIDQAIKRLWNSHFFGNISVYKKKTSYENEMDLIFDLEDLRDVDKIKGIEKVSPSIEKIKSEDKISENNEILIENKWKSLNENKNSKGKRIEIILFEGNKIIPTKILLGFLTKDKFWFTKNIFDSNLKENLRNIRYKYQSMGFRDVQVFLDSVWKKNSGNYGIKIKVIEGKRYYLGNIDFIGNTLYETDFLRKKFFYKTGDIYDKVGIDKNISNPEYGMISYYLNSGYLFSKIIPIEKRIEDNKIHLEIRIEENKPVYINKVNISGNTITKDHVIRRELYTFPGNIFSPREIKYSLLRLENLDLFNKVFPKFIPNKENNTVDIEWRVIEKNYNQIQLNGGYGKGNFVGNLRLNFLNFSINNLFNFKSWRPLPQGDGQKLLLYSQLSQDDTKSYGGSFTEPWLEIISPTSLTLNFNYSKDRIQESEDIFLLPKISFTETAIHEEFLEKKNYSLIFKKFLTFRFPYSTKVEFSINYDKFLYNRYLFSYLDRKFRYNNMNYLISLQRDTSSPDFIFPFKGSEIQVISRFNFPYSIIRRNNEEFKLNWMNFLKLKMKAFWYKKIMDKMVIKSGGEFGLLVKCDESKVLFPFHKFYIGGESNHLSKNLNVDMIPLRGYSFHRNHPESISPMDGGIIYNKSIFEIRYLIKEFSNLSKFWTNLFVEGGNISDSYKVFNPFKMKKSFGLGFRIFWSPIGFFGLDISNPIDRKNFSVQSGWKTNFIIGKE